MSAHRTPIPEALLFKGRKNDPRLGEWVQCVEQIPLGSKKKESLIIMGSPDDTGVLKNRGRAGAKDGPNSIRRHLYRMTLPMNTLLENKLAFYDAGNIIPASDILSTHARAQALATEIASNGHTLIALGGGHDFAAPHFTGYAEGIKKTKPKHKLGLLNIDPHLDLREMEDGLPHSGTPFRMLLESGTLPGNALIQFGTRANRNSRAHFEYAKSEGVHVLTLESLRAKPQTVLTQFEKALKKLALGNAVLGLTIDMDCCSEAEGTSAAPVLGFSALELYGIASIAGSHKNLRYFELAEVAPPLDGTERSSRIAAELIYAFLNARAACRAS